MQQHRPRTAYEIRPRIVLQDQSNPVVVIDAESNTEPLAQALLEGGLPTMEVTFRTPAAKNAIQRIAKAVPGMPLGAGIVLSIEQARIATDSGARYIVSPGYTVEYWMKKQRTGPPGRHNTDRSWNSARIGGFSCEVFPRRTKRRIRVSQSHQCDVPRNEVYPHRWH